MSQDSVYQWLLWKSDETDEGVGVPDRGEDLSNLFRQFIGTYRQWHTTHTPVTWLQGNESVWLSCFPLWHFLSIPKTPPSSPNPPLTPSFLACMGPHLHWLPAKTTTPPKRERIRFITVELKTAAIQHKEGLEKEETQDTVDVLNKAKQTESEWRSLLWVCLHSNL